MAQLVKIEEIVELPHPRAVVWPALSRTDWINRSVKLPAIRYDVEPLPEGGSKVIARAKLFGIPLAWREYPFEWTEPEFHQVRRAFLTGPFESGVFGLRLEETPQGCLVRIFAHFNAKNKVGVFLARRVIGPRTMQDMRHLVSHVGQHLAGQAAQIFPGLPRAAVRMDALGKAIKQLAEEQLPADLVGRLEQWLIEAPDVELSHIRPFSMARHWRGDKWQVLRLFLHATRAGLLNLRWEVLCPNCRATRLPRNSSLMKLAASTHCDVCNIKFDAEFDRSVELKFSVHPAIRPCDESTYCLAGPGARPHIAAQICLEPNEKRVWSLPVTTRELKLRSVQVKQGRPLPAVGGEIICQPETFEIQGSDTSFIVRNPNPFPIQVAVESGAGEEEILTAARATNWQEFRDLFAAEIISPAEQIVVGRQIVLFTDLRGSTAMYTKIGDAPAYALVRDHFRVLQQVIADHHGGVVKTIGDSVMATFSDLGEALNAARQMNLQLYEMDHKGRARLRLKCALHAGPCLAVNANDKLDYFGSVVNLAARLLEKCQGDDLVLADDVFHLAETQSFLRAAQASAEAD
ncbi:MAG TPA: DUF5939 domain-containing protein, partial [Verrucomicrobiae bacterium]